MPHALGFRKPGSPLSGVVWFYVHKKVHLERHSLALRVTAKAAPVLEFIFGDRPLVRHDFQGTDLRSPVSLLVGPRTKPGLELELSGSFESFGIAFHPDGLHNLFGLPVDEITNQTADGASVFGPVVNSMAELLGNCRTFDERVCLANQLLFDIYQNFRCKKGISALVSRILQFGGTGKIDALFRETGLSKRTFERRFREQVGMSAKLFSRIVRFQAALDSKARSPHKSWTFVAQECGYFDQMHLIHDFEEFTAECPGDVLRSVERIYGEHIHAAASRNRSERPEAVLLSVTLRS
jgi:AraC-like DNA-binding protein